MKEKLIELLKTKIQHYREEINTANLSDSAALILCYGLTSKIEAYNEIISYLNAENI